MDLHQNVLNLRYQPLQYTLFFHYALFFEKLAKMSKNARSHNVKQ